MTDREGLVDRLDVLGDVFAGGETPTADLDDTHREAIREALAYRYEQDGGLDGDLTDPAGRRAFLADAADHVDEPHSTVLRELLDAGGST